MKHILVALLCLGGVLPAHASIRAVGAERMPPMPTELEGYFTAALKAGQLGEVDAHYRREGEGGFEVVQRYRYLLQVGMGANYVWR